MNIGSINLNLVPSGAHQRIHVNYGDVGSILTIAVYNGDAVVDLSKMMSVTCKGTKDDGLGFSVACATASDGTATLTLTDAMTDNPGVAQAELELKDSSGTYHTENFDLAVEPPAHASDAIDGNSAAVQSAIVTLVKRTAASTMASKADTSDLSTDNLDAILASVYGGYVLTDEDREAIVAPDDAPITNGFEQAITNVVAAYLEKHGTGGTSGTDGFSPIVKVTRTATGATISITDVNGTTTATVNDGNTYVLTDEDKAAIVAAVVDAMSGTKSVPVTGVAISPEKITLASAHSTFALTATVSPGNATNKTVTWYSSNASVATVTNGVIDAISNGTADIQVKTEDGNFTATCTVTVAIPVVIDTPSTSVDTPTQDSTYFPTATEMKTKMGPGWNYGDQFESSAGVTEPDVRCFGQSGNTTSTNEGLAGEVAFGKPVGTQGLFTALYNHGIRTVRIPVAWGRHVIKASDGTYSISKPFLDRVKTVVNYAYKAGLHIVLNDHGDAWDYFSGWSDSKVVHHNDFASNSLAPFMIFNANDNPDPDKQVAAAKTIWTLIATAFKDYDGHLMFEGCTNEILASHRNSAHNKTRTASWPNTWSASRSWYESFNGGYTLEQMQAVVDKLNNAFISAVRATGGNNTKRVLQVQPLGAIASVSTNQESSWITHMSISDTATDRIMVQIHVYSNGWTTQAAASKIFNYWTTETQYPIVLGETGNALSGTTNISFYTAAKFIGTASKTYSIPCILWDNGKAYDTSSSYKNGAEIFKYIDRKTYETAVLPTSKGMLDPLKAFVDAYNGASSAGENYVTGISIDNWPGYLEAKYGKAIDTSSLTATATYLDGTTKSIPNASLTFSVPPSDGSVSCVYGHSSSIKTENECYMTASYTEDGITVSKGALRIVVDLK